MPSEIDITNRIFDFEDFDHKRIHKKAISKVFNDPLLSNFF